MFVPSVIEHAAPYQNNNFEAIIIPDHDLERRRRTWHGASARAFEVTDPKTNLTKRDSMPPISDAGPVEPHAQRCSTRRSASIALAGYRPHRDGAVLYSW